MWNEDDLENNDIIKNKKKSGDNTRISDDNIPNNSQKFRSIYYQKLKKIIIFLYSVSLNDKTFNRKSLD